MLEADMRKNGPVKPDEYRPPLLGYDPLVAGFIQVSNQLISLRMEQGNPKLKHLPSPQFPVEVAEERIRQFAANRRTDVIARSQAKAKWKQPKAVTADA